MSKRAFALLLAVLFQAAVAQADGRRVPPAGGHGPHPGPRVASAGDGDHKQAADADADADADDDDDDDDDAPAVGDDDDDGAKADDDADDRAAKRAWRGKHPRATTDDDDDNAKADDDDDDAPPPRRTKKPAKPKPTADDEDEDDDATAGDDDDDAPPPRRTKKPTKPVKPARHATTDDADDEDADADADSDDDGNSDDDAPPSRKPRKRPATPRKRPEPVDSAVATTPHIVVEHDVVPPRWNWVAEVLGSKPMDAGNSDLYGMGGGAGLGLEYFRSAALGVHVSASYLTFPAGSGMITTAWASAQVGPRLHLGTRIFGAATGNDAWVDAHVSYGSSGGIRRPGFDLGAALLWEVSPAVRLGPVLRYGFGSDPLDKHAHMLNVGLAVGFGGRTRATVHVEGDADGDGLVDRLDECPKELPGDEPDAAHAGCPTRDGDEDGIADDTDECPDEAAGDTPDPYRDGCPLVDPDTDGDSVKDSVDQCRTEPGPARDDETTTGCPLARVKNQRIEILEQIFFENDSATITESSGPVLEAIAKVIGDLGDARVSIEGHTDEVGSNTYNLTLSKRRARAVAQWLIENGSIAAARLETKGYGKSRPLVTGPEADTSKNRRVEFVILEAR